MLHPRLFALLAVAALLTACGTPPRPPVRAVPTDTLKVSPELYKPAGDAAQPAATAPVQSK